MFWRIVQACPGLFSRHSLAGSGRLKREYVLQAGMLLALLLASCSTNSAQPSKSVFTPPPKPTQTQLPAGTVLYQADWSKGLGAWKTQPGWKVKNGYIESDLSTLSLLLPYHITVPNYVIEYNLQVVNVPKDGGQFQLVADRQPGKDGYTADILHLLSPGIRPRSIHALSEVLIDPFDSMDSSVAQVFDYDPGSDYRLYRVEVRGPRVDFRVMDWLVSRAIDTQTPNLSNGPLHFLSQGAILRISSFRVLAN